MGVNLTSRQVKSTRKKCYCDWCDQTINAGDPSVYETWIYEGDFGQGRYHPECREAIDRWFKKYGRDDDFPDYSMNRGGIEPLGEPEEYPTTNKP